LPRAFRFLTRGLGTRETRSNDMLSLVMFQTDYVKRLIELGEADANARLPEIRRFLGDDDRDGDGQDEHVDAYRTGEVARCELRRYQAIYSCRWS
jgi:hypothetical protein